MSGKKPKYNKNYTFYDKSSINTNKVKEIKANSDIKILSFKSNVYNYKTSLTPCKSESQYSFINDSPNYNDIKNILDNRVKSANSESESTNQANNKDNNDESNSTVTKYSLIIKKEPNDRFHDSNHKDYRIRRVERQLSEKCDPIKISKELDSLFKKLRKSSKFLSKNNRYKCKNQYNDSVFDDNNNKKLMLGNKIRHFNDKKDDRITNVDSNQINLNNSIFQQINDTKSLKEHKEIISKAIKEAKTKINNEELKLTPNENDINDEIQSFYSTKANHKSKRELSVKRKALKYKSNKDTNESFINALSFISNSFSLTLFNRCFHHTCLNERIIYANIFIKDSTKKILKKKFSVSDTLKNLKKSLTGINLLFFKFKFYLHCEPIIEGEYVKGIVNEILEIENEKKNFEIYVLEDEIN